MTVSPDEVTFGRTDTTMAGYSITNTQHTITVTSAPNSVTTDTPVTLGYTLTSSDSNYMNLTGMGQEVTVLNVDVPQVTGATLTRVNPTELSVTWGDVAPNRVGIKVGVANPDGSATLDPDGSLLDLNSADPDTEEAIINPGTPPSGGYRITNDVEMSQEYVLFIVSIDSNGNRSAEVAVREPAANPVVTVTATPGTVTEGSSDDGMGGGTSTLEFSVSGTPAGAITVMVDRDSSSTAHNSTSAAVAMPSATSDYSLMKGSIMQTSVTLDSGNGFTDSLTVEVVADRIVEGDENIVLSYTLSGDGAAGVAMLGNTTITIEDDDTRLRLAAASRTIAEGTEFASAAISRHDLVLELVGAPLSDRVMVTLSASVGTGHGHAKKGTDSVNPDTGVNEFGEFDISMAEDFSLLILQAEIPANTSNFTITEALALNNDEIGEGDETFTLTLTVTNLSAFPNLTVDSPVAVTITDDEVITLEVRDGNAFENGRSSGVSVSMVGGFLTVPLNMTIRTRDGTAMAGVSPGTGDYDPLTDLAVVIPAGESTIDPSVDITINDDTEVEGDETFDITVTVDDTNVPSGVNFTVPSDTVGTITIADIEGRINSNSGLRLDMDEGGAAMYNLVLTYPVSILGDVEIAITSDNTSVTVSPDMVTFTFNNWNREQEITVTSMANSVSTDTTVILTYTLTTTDREYSRLTDSSLRRQEVRVANVDSASTDPEISVRLGLNDDRVHEAVPGNPPGTNSRVNFIVGSGVPLRSSITVNYRISGVENEDFSLVTNLQTTYDDASMTGTVMLDGTHPMRVIIVDILADDDTDNEETMTFEITTGSGYTASNASGSVDVLIQLRIFMDTLANDPTEITEGDSITLTIRSDVVLAADLTVNWTILNPDPANVVFGNDFSLSIGATTICSICRGKAGTFVIPRGSSSVDLTLTANTDSLVEGTEMMSFSIAL